MSNWGEAYESGFRAAARRLLPLSLLPLDEAVDKFVEKALYNEDDGSPTLFAVANHCCGGIDAHHPSCPKA